MCDHLLAFLRRTNPKGDSSSGFTVSETIVNGFMDNFDEGQVALMQDIMNAISDEKGLERFQSALLTVIRQWQCEPPG